STGNSLARQERFEVFPRLGPFSVDKGVVGGVARLTVREDALVADDPVELRSDPLDGAARALVPRVRLEPDRDRTGVVERVAQLEEFRFGVDLGPARVRAEHGPTDLRRPVRAIDGTVPSGPDDRAVAAADGRPRHVLARDLELERLPDIALDHSDVLGR